MTIRIKWLFAEEGQAMVEYALILGLVSIVGLVLSPIGQDVLSIFQQVGSAL